MPLFQHSNVPNKALLFIKKNILVFQSKNDKNSREYLGCRMTVNVVFTKHPSINIPGSSSYAVGIRVLSTVCQTSRSEVSPKDKFRDSEKITITPMFFIMRIKQSVGFQLNFAFYSAS